MNKEKRKLVCTIILMIVMVITPVLVYKISKEYAYNQTIVEHIKDRNTDLAN